MTFTEFKQLVDSREVLHRAFSRPLGRSKNFDQLRHNMVVMLDCDQWAIDVVEFAERGDVSALHELARGDP